MKIVEIAGQLFALAVLISLTGTSKAASFNFDLVFDGAGLSYAPGSDTNVGTVLNPGDDYTLTISAAGESFFRVLQDDSVSFPVTFFVEPSGSRTGNVTTTFFLNGSQVDQQVLTNVSQSAIHVGMDSYDFSATQEFDSIVQTYDFVSGAQATISDSSSVANPDWASPSAGDFGFLTTPGEDTFFASRASIEYVAASVSPVPIPYGFTLLTAALVLLMGLVFSRRSFAVLKG